VARTGFEKMLESFCFRPHRRHRFFKRRYEAGRLRVSGRLLRDSARVRRWLHAGTERSVRYRRYQHAERATGHQTSGGEGDSVRLETIIGKRTRRSVAKHAR
jgi:hypothetical protein